jgi:hypothetical protein
LNRHRIEVTRWWESQATKEQVETGPHLFGHVVDPLPDGWTADGVVVLVRATDVEGNPRTCARTSGRVYLWEELGMLANEEIAVRRMLAELPRDPSGTVPGA